ncbi:Type IV fimbrial biogenesis protein PilW [Microbacterium sp. 8M]|uniref:type II secretion system protein n=1 Tax=Microbacterium sp. 8M TaxID=2653153 RepID=UPI0012F3D304|nr:type II secretion system protein [Microbacterium sp. 8M]VXB54540.1 Type IV fimbrial biogenesis protein PilW [Microbacterium sp. 8M]
MDPRADEGGFGLVELIVAMFLLAIITIALIPALYNGLIYAARQSTTATATRQLNTLVEQARQTHTCNSVMSAASTQSFTDGAKQVFTTSGTYSCTTGSVASLNLTAKDSDNRTLASVKALVYIP